MKKPRIIKAEMEKLTGRPNTWLVVCPDCSELQWLDDDQFAGRKQIECGCGFTMKAKVD